MKEFTSYSFTEALKSREAYEVLGDDLNSWTQGGCWVLAEAIKKWVGPRAALYCVRGIEWGRYEGGSVPHHVVARIGGYYLDADGIDLGSERIRDTWSRVERLSDLTVETFLPRYRKAALKLDIVCPPEAVKRVAAFLEKKFGPGEEAVAWMGGEEVRPNPPANALVIMHLSSLDTLEWEDPREADALADRLIHAVQTHDGPVFVVDQGWPLTKTGTTSARRRFTAATKQSGKTINRLVFDEETSSWNAFLPKIIRQLNLAGVTSVDVAGLWYRHDLTSGCATTLYLALKKRFKARVREDLVACESDDATRSNPKRASPPLDMLYEERVLSEAYKATKDMKLASRTPVLRQYVLRIYTRPAGSGRAIAWLLYSNKELIGTGRLFGDHEHAHAGIAVIAKPYRRQGLYAAVLSILRKKLGVPIESDVSMTAGAIGAWKKAGGELTDRAGDKVFRINPWADLMPWWT